jgi:D-beta-D-heptose 7-phosphate kinase/D-beta-D-heptose 1-phosphate adenosyltransferase
MGPWFLYDDRSTREAAANDGLQPDGVHTFSDWSDAEFLRLCDMYRDGGLDGETCLGVVNGCFDLLHVGHVNLIRRAASYIFDGQKVFLVVLVNSDSSVVGLKGGDRPVVPEVQRMWMLAALWGVQAVALFRQPTPEQAMNRLRPDVMFKGAAYAKESIPGRKYCGKVVFLDETPGVSTTTIVNKVRT